MCFSKCGRTSKMRCGKARRDGSRAFGIEGGIFDHFFRTEEAKQTFVQGMHGLGLLSSPKVVEAFDLSRFRRLVDLGGATGHLGHRRL